MDKSVHLTFLGICIFALLFLLVQCKKGDECILPKIECIPANPVQGDTLRCSIKASNPMWETSSGTTSFDSTPAFFMKDSGDFTINATMPNNCTQSKIIHVSPSIVKPLFIPQYFVSTNEAKVGQEIILQDITPESTDRTWVVDGNELPTSSSLVSKLKFKTPGVKTIIFSVNTPTGHGSSSITLNILVPTPSGDDPSKHCNFKFDEDVTKELKQLAENNRLLSFKARLRKQEETETSVSKIGSKIKNYYDFCVTEKVEKWEIESVLVKRCGPDANYIDAIHIIIKQ